MEVLSKNIYVETEFSGCNVGFVATREGVVMIDTPFRPSDALLWRDEIAKKGEIRYLINTEHHPDHVLGNSFFPGTIVGHQLCREWFRESVGSLDPFRKMMEDLDPEGLHLLRNYQVRLPSITFQAKLNLYLGEYTFQLINMPGHLPHQVVVYIPEAKVLFASDNIFNGIYPWMHECAPLAWLDSLKEIEGMDVVIVPGHGPVCGKEAILPLREYLSQVVSEVDRGIEQGLKREEVISRASYSPPFPVGDGPGAMEDWFPGVHRQGIGRVYDELSRVRQGGKNGKC